MRLIDFKRFYIFQSNLYKGKETTLITGTAAQCGVVLDGKDFLVTGTQLQPKCQN